MDAIGMLAGGLAHDLNNILAPMLMAASLLKTRMTSASDQKMIAMIEGGAQRGADIIRQLLTFSRGEVAARGPVQLRHLIREMVHIMNETFPRNIEVESFSPSELWPVEGDATQLHQVLLNLCVNARDAMPRGGKLTVTAENVTVDEASARPHPQVAPGAYVLLLTKDTGEGIPPEIINRIFDPFFTTKPVGKGTGLGLSTVLGIVKNHEGAVMVDSEPGRGTTFRIYFPRSASPVEAGPRAPDTLPRGEGETILLVDDETAMRDSTRAVLEHNNYRVLPAGHGEEALAMFVRHRSDVRLIVTDVDMPVMDGVELVRSIRVLNPDMHIVVMSGSAQVAKREELAALGVNEVLKKPYDPAILLGRIRAELGPVAGSWGAACARTAGSGKP
jgi:CheY-like chemotaxis protein